MDKADVNTMNIDEITNTITELENGPTTFETCMKLASLYTVRDNLHTDVVKSEYFDILPSYESYADIKKRYSNGEISIDAVTQRLSFLSEEIYQFIQTLYASTESPEERDILNKLQNKLNIVYK